LNDGFRLPYRCLASLSAAARIAFRTALRQSFVFLLAIINGGVMSEA
jgi:hypothetical protein